MDMNGTTNEINFAFAFEILKKKIVLLLAIAIFAGAAGWAYAQFVAVPQYTSYATMYVYNTDEINHEEKNSVSYNDLYAAQTLAGPYMVVLQSETLLKKVANDLNNVITTTQLKSGLSVSTVEETVVLYVSFTSEDPQLCRDVVRSITVNFQQEITRIRMGGGAEIIDEASEPKLTYPSAIKFFIISAALAFVITFILLLIFSKKNEVIRDDTDFEREFSVPCLGSIPKIEFENEKTGGK